jgi:hypothetical protein
MLDAVTAETFLPHRGSDFEARDSAGRTVVLRLVDVRSLGPQPGAPRVDPFALEFSGPAQPALEQAIHRLEHPELGALEIFLVPTGIAADGARRYEAVFN